MRSGQLAGASEAVAGCGVIMAVLLPVMRRTDPFPILRKTSYFSLLPLGRRPGAPPGLPPLGLALHIVIVVRVRTNTAVTAGIKPACPGIGPVSAQMWANLHILRPPSAAAARLDRVPSNTAQMRPVSLLMEHRPARFRANPLRRGRSGSILQVQGKVSLLGAAIGTSGEVLAGFDRRPGRKAWS